jgi:predicted nucleic acid-binding protein
VRIAAQAQEKSANEEATLFFIGDEKRARDKCQTLGLLAVETVRLLARLNRQGDAEETKALVRKLRRDLQFRVSEQVVEEAIRMASVPI